ncbi:TniQ protein [Devosia lucknowensis]|uniref:TniQ protein n=1 Tax=Devosia lucknowensis TaxID=1096929 RepID=A0A1Y6G997_9HYPH|nr:TniQ family protein [Devosia lucknowensis]SMQ85288.1 TniQ protein [Devosia lucknowensis]
MPLNRAPDASPLRLRHALKNNEVATGFASRLAAVNGCSLADLLFHRGILLSDLGSGDAATIRLLAAIGSADPDQLLHQAVLPTPQLRRWQLVGEIFGPDGINRTFFRYCPHCVLEDLHTAYGPPAARPWMRIEWTLKHYRVCHRHHSMLLAVKPTKAADALDFCNSLSPLLRGMQNHADDAGIARPSPYHAWIARRLDMERDPDNWLDTLPLRVGAAWCENLGASILFPDRMTKLTEEQIVQACDEGFRIASAGEHAMRAAFLGMNKAKRRATGLVRPVEVYRYAYRLLGRTLDDEGFQPLRKLLRDFGTSTMPWAEGTDFMGVTIDKPELVTVTHTALQANVSKATIRRLFSRHGLGEREIAEGKPSRDIAVPRQEAELVVRQLKRSVGYREAMGLLGIKRKTFDGLVASGILSDCFGRGAGDTEFYRFSVDDIHDLVERMLEGAVEVSPGDRQSDIVAIPRRLNARIAEIISLVLDGKVRWKGRLEGRSDFGALVLDVDEVHSLILDSRPSLVHLRNCDVPGVIVGLSKNSVTPLIDLDQLDTTTEVVPIARRVSQVVTRASAEAFHRNYVTATELSQRHGVNQKSAKQRLEAVGVLPAFDPEVVNTVIFDRTEVERATHGRDGFWAQSDYNLLRRELRAAKRSLATDRRT